MELLQTTAADPRVLQLFGAYDDFIIDFLGEDRVYYTRYTPDERLETVWLALCDEQPAGVVAYRRRDTATGEVKRLFVAPAYRGRGTGTALLDTVEAHAIQQGCQKLFLDTRATLQPAVDIYRRRGFCEVFRAGLYIQMEKPL